MTMNINPQEVKNYLRRKQALKDEKRLELWKVAQQETKKIIEMIIENYQPKQIIQWGSILEPKHFSEASDIDLAIIGLDSITFLKLLADAEDMTQFPLDLVQWEKLDPSFQRIILRKGKTIYGE